MRTVTKNINANKGDTSFPMPAEWVRLIELTFNNSVIAYGVFQGKKTVIELSEPLPVDGILTARVILKDSVDK